MVKRIAVFCGSRKGNSPAYTTEAQKLVRVMASQEIGLVYGGGNVGLMKEIADEMVRLNGEVIGVIPQKLVGRELAHQGLTRLEIVDTMHQRKAMMAELSDAFIAIPGGIGTLEEIIEVFSWFQLGYHNKPCGFLNTGNYFDLFFRFLDKSVAEGFLDNPTYSQILISNDPEELIQLLKTNS